MDIFSQANWTKFTKLVPEIRQNVKQWRIVSVIIRSTDGTDCVARDVAVNLSDFMSGWDGAIFVTSAKEVACFVRTGEGIDADKFRGNISHTLRDYDCKIQTKAATYDGLKRIEVVVSKSMAAARAVSEMQKIRESRDEKVIMVVDDDMFIRSLVANGTKRYGRVVELDTGADVAETFKKEAPDAVFMDVHLPDRNGKEILRDLMLLDTDAQVVMISSDGTRENIVESRMEGACGFISKPITREKIDGTMRKMAAFNPELRAQRAARLEMLQKSQKGLTAYDKKRQGRKEKVILVVDDDMFIRKLLVTAAQNHGRVVEMTSGTDVLKAYDEHVPDAVFLDIHLPGISGDAILREINAKDPNAFVIMVSSDAARDIVVDMHNIGASGFLSKPVTADKIKESLMRNSAFC